MEGVGGGGDTRTGGAMAQQVSLWFQMLRQPFVLVDEEQHTDALPGSTGWEPGSPVTTGREGCTSEMFMLSLGICIPDLPHLKTLSRLYWKLYFVIYSQNKKSFNEGRLAMENSGVTL